LRKVRGGGGLGKTGNLRQGVLDMRHAQWIRNGSSVRLAVAAMVLLVVASPAFSYTWLGPFPDVPPVVVNPTPPVEETVPPIFDWTETPPTDVVIDSGPPTT